MSFDSGKPLTDLNSVSSYISWASNRVDAAGKSGDPKEIETASKYVQIAAAALKNLSPVDAKQSNLLKTCERLLQVMESQSDSQKFAKLKNILEPTVPEIEVWDKKLLQEFLHGDRGEKGLFSSVFGSKDPISKEDESAIVDGLNGKQISSSQVENLLKSAKGLLSKTPPENEMASKIFGILLKIAPEKSRDNVFIELVNFRLKLLSQSSKEGLSANQISDLQTLLKLSVQRAAIQVNAVMSRRGNESLGTHWLTKDALTVAKNQPIAPPMPTRPPPKPTPIPAPRSNKEVAVNAPTPAPRKPKEAKTPIPAPRRPTVPKKPLPPT